MADSSLVSYERWVNNEESGHPQGRNTGFGTICVHHMAGNLSLETCGNVFVSNDVSAHYAIDSDGNVGQYVPESCASWSCGSAKWNHCTISIECANIGGDPNWPVSDATIAKLKLLIVDIARRNGWSYIGYSSNPDDSDIIGHRDVASTACPGDYLYSLLPSIAAECDAILKGEQPEPTPTPVPPAGKIDVDGIWGVGTNAALQRVLGCDTVDGIISSQGSDDEEFIPCHDEGSAWQFVDDANGSLTIVALQKMVGETETDGLFGQNTIKKLQTWLNENCAAGLEVDGVCGELTCKALQTWLNTKIEA